MIGRRSTHAALASLGTAALCAGTIASTAAPSSASSQSRVIHTDTRPLTLSSVVVDNPLESAVGQLHATVNTTQTVVRLRMAGVDAAEGAAFPAHVHVGPCTTDLAEAGGHYNSGGPVDDDHESWLTFTVNPAGRGVGHDSDHFVIARGDAQSVVVHAPDGTRLGCLPVDF